MRILVTGSQGTIGAVLIDVLREAGHHLRTLDKFASSDPAHIPGDLRDLYLLRRAAAGMDAIVHLGAVGERRGAQDEVLDINVRGTWNVLLAAEEAGVGRVVYFSSVNAIGCVGGYGAPDYLPLDDDHPHRPVSAYQLSKHLAEEVCRSFALNRGITTVCLRPLLVTDPERHYRRWASEPAAIREDLYQTELFGYIDVRDVAQAALLALTADVHGFEAILLTADDTTAETPTCALVDAHFGGCSWRGGPAYFDQAPHRALVSGAKAREVLGFVPRHHWRDD